MYLIEEMSFVSPRNIQKDQKMRELRRQRILDSALQTIVKKGVASVDIEGYC